MRDKVIQIPDQREERLLSSAEIHLPARIFPLFLCLLASLALVAVELIDAVEPFLVLLLLMKESCF